jgi:hypothetical protein
MRPASAGCFLEVLMSYILSVPNKLEASSFNALRRLMLQTNTKLGGQVIYDIHPPAFQGAKWYAFYTEQMDSKEMLGEQIKDVG